MTLSTTTVRADYDGSGSAGPFAFTFKIFAATDLVVTKRAVSGVESTLAYLTDYTVSGVGETTGGSVTLDTALATSEHLTIRRVSPLTQTTDFRNQGSFFPASEEDTFDKVVAIDQSQQDQLDRALKLPPSIAPANVSAILPAPSAGQALFWNGTATAIETRSVDGGVTTLPGNSRVVSTLSAYLDHGKRANVLDYAADGTLTGSGGVDWTATIQTALDTNGRAVVPEHAVLRVDGTVTVGAQQTLIVLGQLWRYAAHSTSTRPLVRVQGDYGAVLGGGTNSVLGTENASPDGILLYGVESPVSTASSVAIRWFEGRDLRLVGSGNTLTNKALVLQSMEAYGTGALYDGHFHNIKVFDVGRAIYLNSIANGNTFDLINCWDVRRAVDIAGDSEGAFLTTDANVSNLFVDNSPNLECIVRARNCQHTAFSNINGEPGVGKHHDIDATCSRITLLGADNCPDASTWAATLSAKIVNGVLTADTASIASLTATSAAATAQTFGAHEYKTASAFGPVASGGTATFDFTLGTTFPVAFAVDAEVVANHGGVAAQNSRKLVRLLVYLLTDALSQNVTATAVASDAAGYAPADIAIAASAVGSGNKLRLTISNANAASMSGAVAFRFLGAAATPVAA